MLTNREIPTYQITQLFFLIPLCTVDFVFEGDFPSTSLWVAYTRKGDLTEGCFALPAGGGLIFEGAYTWRGLFSEFYGTCLT